MASHNSGRLWKNQKNLDNRLTLRTSSKPIISQRNKNRNSWFWKYFSRWIQRCFPFSEISSRFLVIFTFSCGDLSWRASYLHAPLPSNTRYASRQAAVTKREDCEKMGANFKKRKTASNSVREILSESTISVSEVENEFYFVALCNQEFSAQWLTSGGSACK